MDYAELHCHSCFSLREGASTPGELIGQALQLGYRALALTDHDGVYGSMEFSKAATEAGLPDISGAEVTLASGHHLTLLAETTAGWANLCHLLTHAYIDHETKDEPRIERETLSARADGLIALSGCSHGEVPSLLMSGRDGDAEKAAAWYRDVFSPGSYFLELQDNFGEFDRDRVNSLVRLAAKLGLPCVATNNAHYHVPQRHRLQDVLVAVRHRTTLQGAKAFRRGNAEYYLKSPAQMARLFGDLPAAMSNTIAIAERCTFRLARDVPYEFPAYAVPLSRQHPPAFFAHYRAAVQRLGHSAAPSLLETARADSEVRVAVDGDAYLEAVCRLAMERKFPPGHRHHVEAQARLLDELRLIAKHRLAGFFLVYFDLLTLAAEIAHTLRGRDPTLPPDVQPVGRGRGSSVSSLVCYLIGLSHVDPIANELFLGRFLTEELASIPDIDLDFPRDIREQLLKRVWTYFDRDRAALLCAFATYRTRSAIRDVGKALDLPPVEVDRLAKLSDLWAVDGIANEMARLPEYASKLQAPIWRDLVDLSTELLGFPRHVGQHVGGMVLSARSIKDAVAVEPARTSGRYVIQWDKDSVDDARMVKIDFLALGMLSLVDECLSTIRQRHGEAPDLGRVDHTDHAIFDRICAGDTIGIFQIESRAQIQTLPFTQPRNLDDLAVEVAIIRPGPIVAGAFHPYMDYRARAARGEPIDVKYLHPSLEGPLRETLGVIVYQDQVLLVAMAAAGYTAGEAARLRRAMSRRRSREVMSEEWPRFLEGCQRLHAMSEGIAQEIFESLLAFAAFGFPKSHAVAFALLAYESAWLRYHFPEEYYCALFNNQPMGFYTVEVLVGDAARHHIKFLAPDINASSAQCTVEGTGRIRLGIHSVKSIGLPLARQIVADRDGRGLYPSIFQFSQRLPMAATDQVENLIMAGAFDSFGLERRELVWQLGLFRRPAADGQQAIDLPLDQDMETMDALTVWDGLRLDYELLGLSPDRHPMALLRGHLHGVISSRELGERREGERVTIAGLVVCRQRPGSANGVVFMLLEDEFALINVVIYPKRFEAQRQLIRLEPFVRIEGRVQWRGPSPNILAEHFEALHLPELLISTARNFH